MTILLTGATGFIGRNLKECWQNRYDLASPSHEELNLLDTAAVESYLRERRFDVVIHAANTNDVVHPERAAHLLDCNLRMFCNLERCSGLYGRMYYFGSGAEYDSTHYTPKMPESCFGKHIPADPYGFSKYVMSKIAGRSHNIHDLRLFGVFGKYEEWHRRFISNMIYQALNSRTMHMDRHMFFDFLYVDDLAAIMERFITHEPAYHHYNVCSGQRWDLYDLALMVKEETGSDAKVVTAGEGWKRPYTGDNSRLRAELGELRLTPMREAVREMILFYRKTGFQ